MAKQKKSQRVRELEDEIEVLEKKIRALNLELAHKLLELARVRE